MVGTPHRADVTGELYTQTQVDRQSVGRTGEGDGSRRHMGLTRTPSGDRRRGFRGTTQTKNDRVRPKGESE